MTQLTAAAILTKYNTLFADNTTGDITEAVLREFMEDLKDSFFNISDNPGKVLSDNNYTGTEKTKLAGVATGATANATDAQLRDRTTHTGEQAANTITDLPKHMRVEKLYGIKVTSDGGGDTINVLNAIGQFSGSITWNRTGPGEYTITSADNEFTANKTFAVFVPSDPCFYTVQVVDTATITIKTRTTAGALSDLVNNAFFKVEVYR